MRSIQCQQYSGPAVSDLIMYPMMLMAVRLGQTKMADPLAEVSGSLILILFGLLILSD